MSPSWIQLLIVVVVALLLFGGRGRISSIMGDMAKGIGAFRKGLKDEEETKSVEKDEMVDVTPKRTRRRPRHKLPTGGRLICCPESGFPSFCCWALRR